MDKRTVTVLALAILLPMALRGQDFKIGEGGYFRNEGVDVMAFYDFYPEGHQGGVCIIMNGNRVATNGDLRFEATPGQWQPVPRQISREVGKDAITAKLAFPDSSRHLTGFNPMIYPDAIVEYTVTTKAVGDHIEVTLDLDRPIPEYFIGKAGFNLEFFPGALFGRPWIMDRKSGIFPRQPNSPLLTTEPNYKHTGDFHQDGKPIIDLGRLVAEGEGYNPIVADDIIAEPYAVGRKFVSRPDDPYSKLTIETLTEDLKLYDGRMNHNNGWFVLRSEIPAGATKGAVKWIITPNVVKGWKYAPVIQTSQVGYHPGQPKVAILELDKSEVADAQAEVIRIDADGEHTVLRTGPKVWGSFLRYNYAEIDFSGITEPGLYRIDYKGSTSSVFRIAEDVYKRGVWQPVIEYFLPNQMCHMRVNEKYRVWHDACHLDDAKMALNENGIDGYNQEPGISVFSPGSDVPAVAIGGWHDAGDLDLRIESQAGESYILAMAYEQFHPDIDVTAIDFDNHVTEIHQSDGKNDILQQVENGVLSVVSAYEALGRPYRGIISSKLRQYVILGDAAAMTDGVPGNGDDRWIYTENNPSRDLSTAASLAGAARALRGYNDGLAKRCLNMATDLFWSTEGNKMHAAVELYLTTKEKRYRDYILENKESILRNVSRGGWYAARLAKAWEKDGDKDEKAFAKAFRDSIEGYKASIAGMSSGTPYGVPYQPSIWGAGWDIQRFGYEYYFMAAEYPEILSPDPVFDALHFILGRHPGSNTASFASGVGAVSATTAYGTTRADWSYVPGGVISGTAIIRPDLPELLEFPYLWQQTEYVLGGGSSHYMFLVLAADALLGRTR
ncbi:MAG: glycoside hydrolase family 9 protein [Bacteroidales bacterium]|nr:glycoside hydrolase family 9 protein [Bacteroidales bacterium]